eukprot:PITA_36718
MENISKKLGKQMEYLETASSGWEGGLAILWNPQILQLISSEAARSHISIEVQMVGNPTTYLCTNVYGPQKLEAKLLWLRALSNLQQRYPQAKAIFGGDFNMITSLREKKGGIKSLNRDSETFKDFIKSTRLVDIFPKSGTFTWNNNRGGDRKIASRLDMFLVTETILLEGITVDSNILPSGGLDHWPIIMNAAILDAPRNKPFRFEKFWLSHPEFTTKIKQCQIALEPNINREEAIRDLVTSIPKLISEDQNKALNRAITLEEVEEVVKDMPNGKALGPDGFAIDFYKACWEIIKTKVWEVVGDSQRFSSILNSLNSTFITLIPKEEEANTLSKFRPIALCNVVYKIISKVIANRLKPILLGIISEEQSGYVEGRQIMDNILLAQEMIHTLQTQKKTGMLIWLDLSKAYDKVSWNYLEAILDAFGFAKQWIIWILALIKSTRFSILVNKAPTAQFTPSQSLQQGDPLSPFLFVILMEGLSRLIRREKEDGII